MASGLVVEAPAGAAKWGIALASSITACLNAIKEEMNTTNSKIDKLFQQLSQQLISDVKEATNLATEARNIE